MSLWSRRVVAGRLSLSFSLSLSYAVFLASQETFLAVGECFLLMPQSICCLRELV